MKIKGSGTYTDASGRSHTILGIGKLSDDENLRDLQVSGKLEFDKISCDEISVSGKCDGGSISANDLETSGELLFDNIFCDEVNISGKCIGDSVSAKNFSVSGKAKIDSLTLEENLNLSGKPEINSVTADEIVIASRDGFITRIKCRRIRILEDLTSNAKIEFGSFFGERCFFSASNSRVRIKNIEAETVELENCEVDVIRCRDAFIGKNCAVKKLFVAGECTVDADSTVSETIRT